MRRMRGVRAVVIAVGLAGTDAHAQSAEQLATRRVLLEEAQSAARANDPVRALDLAQRALAIESTPSVRLFVAEQSASLGLVTAAMGSAEQCEREAERDVAMNNRDAILARCRTLEATYRAMVARLTVIAPLPLPVGLHVQINGRDFDEALLGVPVPVDPGLVVVTATADGHTGFHTEFRATSGQRLETRLFERVALPPAPMPAPVPAAVAITPVPIAAPPVVVEPPTPPSPPIVRPVSAIPRIERPILPARPASRPVVATPARGASVAPWVMLGSGVVAGGVAGAFFALEIDARSPCEALGSRTICPTVSAQRHAAGAPTWRALGITASVAGGALAIGGAVWAIVQSTQRTPRGIEVSASADERGGALAVGGVW